MKDKGPSNEGEQCPELSKVVELAAAVKKRVGADAARIGWYRKERFWKNVGTRSPLAEGRPEWACTKPRWQPLVCKMG